MPEAKIEETICEDRISELPEDLLVRILSLVPTKNAVATMFLSKRWFSVWTMVRTLEYKDSEDEKDDDDESKKKDDDDESKKKDDDDESKKSVWWFLNKSLQFHKAHVIDGLHIELGPRCPSDADVGKLVANVVNRHILDLYFKLLWSTDPISLPKSLYTCKTLERLTLSHKILVDFPSSCCLPSLLVLQLLFVVYKDETSLVRFLSSCPILKVLVVERKNDDNVTKFSVKVPSLWMFWYSLRNDSDSDVVETGRCLVIDTPALKTFSFINYSGESCSVESMPRLKVAYIDVESFPGSDELIRSLSSVLSLKLFFTNEVVKRCGTINLSRLRKLRICPNESDWLEPLMLLLGNAPKLRTLTIDCESIYEPEEITLSWNQPSSVPRCLSSQLRIFKWIEYGDSIEEEEFLTYVFANSKCLKTAKISLRSTFDILKDQDLIIEELKDIPRVSTASQLLVQRIL